MLKPRGPLRQIHVRLTTELFEMVEGLCQRLDVNRQDLLVALIVQEYNAQLRLRQPAVEGYRHGHRQARTA